ncbi:unnamed protein product, partial [Symbiodinium microadriaticum]
ARRSTGWVRRRKRPSSLGKTGTDSRREAQEGLPTRPHRDTNHVRQGGAGGFRNHLGPHSQPG